MKKVIFIILLIVIVVVFAKYWPFARSLYKSAAPPSEDIVSLIEESDKTAPPGQNSTNFPLKVPDGYRLSVFAKGLVSPRDMILDSEGNLIVSIPSKGKVVVVSKGQVHDLINNLNKPHGLALKNYRLYVAESNIVKVYDYDPITYSIGNSNTLFELPGDGLHFTRSLLIKGETLYVSTGSSCNICVENSPMRAAIWSSDLKGGDLKQVATGLRNSVFMTLNPDETQIWATNMGRDNLGDDLPPDTINVIKEGANYGWPYCYGNKITDVETNKNNSKFDCTKMEAPTLEIPAHSAPLGLAFLDNDLLVAYHGSWNRKTPTGYKIVRFKNGLAEDFLTGWLTENGDVLGRPADILIKNNGDEIFISDDKAGVIYLLSKV